MRKSLYCSAVALLLCSAGYAVAQGQPDQPTPPGQATAPMHTTPPTGAAQPQAPQADQAKPAAVGPAQAAADGQGTGHEVPGATRQTMPSTISAENAAQDKLPITAFQFPLTDEQKRKIAASVANVPATAGEVNAHVSQKIPANVEMKQFPIDVIQSMPATKDYRFVKLPDRVLIVDPPNWTVVGEIGK